MTRKRNCGNTVLRCCFSADYPSAEEVKGAASSISTHPEEMMWTPRGGDDPHSVEIRRRTAVTWKRVEIMDKIPEIDEDRS